MSDDLTILRSYINEGIRSFFKDIHRTQRERAKRSLERLAIKAFGGNVPVERDSFSYDIDAPDDFTSAFRTLLGQSSHRLSRQDIALLKRDAMFLYSSKLKRGMDEDAARKATIEELKATHRDKFST